MDIYDFQKQYFQYPSVFILVYKFDDLYIAFLFAIFSYNAQQIFIKLGFLESAWNSSGLDWKKKSGKIQSP